MTPIVPSSKPRRSYRAPVGMPKGREDWRIGTAVSLLVHLSVLFALIAPFAAGATLILREQGAGGPGPSGGGGGGRRGTGGVEAEVLRFITVSPPPVQPAPTVQPPPALPTPTPPPQAQVAEAKPADAAPVPGTGGGTGADTAGGSGPGSGGGVGSGVGTGRGSGIGPGTGGGNQTNFPPSAIEMFLPPLPVPSSARGFHVLAEYDIDEAGKVLKLDFTPTPDRGYNRRLRDALMGYKFRPGTRPDGTPIRMKYQLVVDLP